MTIRFATTNDDKFMIAKSICDAAGIPLERVAIDIDEIQGEDADVIIKDKAQKAYDLVRKPVIVSDDSWNIPALNGFPGPYMKSVNHWFTTDDYLRLMHGITDRRIILHQCLALHDGTTITLYKMDTHGVFTYEARGQHATSPNMQVITLENGNGETIAESLARTDVAAHERFTGRRDVWQEFVEQYAA